MIASAENSQNIWDLVSGLQIAKMDEIGIVPFLLLLAVSLLCSFFISFLYVTFYNTRATGSNVHRSFPLLGVSITAIFICIQFSLPLSLGLLGALSIVRFRTPIKEPEEIGFIMLVVASSLCCATFNLVFLGLFLVAVVLGLLVMHFTRGKFHDSKKGGMLTISLPIEKFHSSRSKLVKFLNDHIKRGRIDSITENHDEAVLSYHFHRLGDETLIELRGQLRNLAKEAKLNVYYNRSSEV
ncbi:MAG: DUF4956 domain-containing protein [Phycisphaerae bacterium]|nr:DUF4956 domain-containing protein [Phycisphaerae bacterium]